MGPKLYKILLPDGKPAHGGKGEWNLPKGKKPGAWMPKIGDPQCCERGYHLVTAAQAIAWLNREGLVVWESQGRGANQKQDDKSAWAEARLVKKVGVWTEKKARLFAADCAEAVLHIFEKEYPDDKRPRKAIEAARAFAFGKIDAAAWAAAWAAARDAAWDAARAAARDAERVSARDAERDAAWAAAWAAAWDAQGRRLLYWLRRDV